MKRLKRLKANISAKISSFSHLLECVAMMVFLLCMVSCVTNAAIDHVKYKSTVQLNTDTLIILKHKLGDDPALLQIINQQLEINSKIVEDQ